MGLSIGSEVVVTLHAGVLPYVSTVNTVGSGILNIPQDTMPIAKSDIDIWSSNSQEAVKRLRFVRGMAKLNLKDCGSAMFNYLYDSGFDEIITLVSFCRSVSFEPSKLIDYMMGNGGFSITGPMTVQITQLMDRFKSLDYRSLIETLLIPGIGSKTAYVIALKLSGLHVKADFEKGISKIIQAKVLDNKDLCAKIKANSQTICIEDAEGTIEHDEFQHNSLH